MTSPGSALESHGPPRAALQRLAPDRELVRRVVGSGGEALRQCMQCATCSSVCDLSQERGPFPRKEMLWAQWGLRERLMADPDIWVCHECHECTRRCPRGARPGDVMAALRRECIVHYSRPRALGRLAHRPAGLAALVLGAAVLIAAVAFVWEASGAAAAERALFIESPRIVFPFWSRLPHGALHLLFGAAVVFDAVVLLGGARRFWRDLHRGPRGADPEAAPRPMSACLGAALRRALWHDDFAGCSEPRSRHVSHALLVQGLAGLLVVDLWVVGAQHNPLLRGMVVPLALTSPWKLLANGAGLAVLGGTVWLWRERLRRPAGSGPGTFGDHALLALLAAAVLSGFGAELLHLARQDELRTAIYAAHLITVLTLFAMLPFCKAAHPVYRLVALLFVERRGGRARPSRSPAAVPEANT